MVNTDSIKPPSDLVERLAAHRTLAGAPRAEHAWLAAHGTLQRYEAGEVIVATGVSADFMMVILTGRIGAHLQRGTGRRHLFEFGAGEVSGVLPYSRLAISIGVIIAEEATEALAVLREQIPEMIRECPVVTEKLVHVMVDRTRKFTSTDWQDEKMASLGRLAAGMAHELNNPASATVRGASLLTATLTALEQASLRLGALALTESQMATITALRDASLVPATTGVFSAMERADHEDDVTAWLESHGADTDSAAALADAGLTAQHMDELSQAIPPRALDPALAWLAAARTARSLSSDIGLAGGRIYELVSAVKRFSHMDRATASEPTNVAQGITDTVTVLSGKARARNVAIRLDIAPDLPLVPAFAAELNQVWSNLIDNALDAVGESGLVTVRAEREGEQVVVRVSDDGPGIPDDVRSRIFDPFFTTKPVGQGSGLGLDISRRIVREHLGEIVVESRPGHTEFRVALPLQRPQGA
ncbi:MAG: sensor histidine kinase [Gemmatimonadales bacterium]